MRVLRTLVGLVLVLVGFPALLVGTAGWLALQHRDDRGAFTAQLAPMHADGYALVVPDIAAGADRFGLAPLLGHDTVRVSVSSAAEPVVLLLAPEAQVRRYLTGVPHSEVTSVGYAVGSQQPVALAPVDGDRNLAPAREQTFWQAASTAQLDWEGPRSGPTSLVVLRADGRAGIDATLSVGRVTRWLPRASWALLVAGAAGLIGGITLLFAAAEPVLVVDAQRVIDLADELTERVDPYAPGRTLAVLRGAPGYDLVGELRVVATRRRRPAEPTSPAPPWDDAPWNDGTGESPYVYTAT